MKIADKLREKLEARAKNNSLRSFMLRGDQADFYSNDYLGISQLFFDGEEPSGSTGSRLISGHSELTLEVETELAQFFNQESALLFNSGYDANLGFFSSVPQKNDTVIYDSLIHASVRDGLKMGFAKNFSFRHNDLVDLKSKLERTSGDVYIAVESIYSMDGDQAPLKELAALCTDRNLYLVVDEAHSAGLYGEKGVGLVTHLGLDNQVFAKLITFGKAYGSHGAAFLGAEELKIYLTNFARPLIYSTALSPHAQKRIIEAVRTVAELTAERHQLHRNIQLFRTGIDSRFQMTKSDSPIQTILIPGNEAAKKLADHIQNNGFAVKAILSPTVAAGAERIRFCIHSFNTEREIHQLTRCINES